MSVQERSKTGKKEEMNMTVMTRDAAVLRKKTMTKKKWLEEQRSGRSQAALGMNTGGRIMGEDRRKDRRKGKEEVRRALSFLG